MRGGTHDDGPRQVKITGSRYAVDAAEAGWTGEVGYVSADMIKKCLPSAGDDTTVLMCGPPAMIEKAVVPALDTLGYSADSRVFF